MSFLKYAGGPEIRIPDRSGQFLSLLMNRRFAAGAGFVVKLVARGTDKVEYLAFSPGVPIWITVDQPLGAADGEALLNEVAEADALITATSDLITVPRLD
jgi:hypothetical protein